MAAELPTPHCPLVLSPHVYTVPLSEIRKVKSATLTCRHKCYKFIFSLVFRGIGNLLYLLHTSSFSLFLAFHYIGGAESTHSVDQKAMGEMWGNLNRGKKCEGSTTICFEKETVKCVTFCEENSETNNLMWMKRSLDSNVKAAAKYVQAALKNVRAKNFLHPCQYRQHFAEHSSFN